MIGDVSREVLEDIENSHFPVRCMVYLRSYIDDREKIPEYGVALQSLSDVTIDRMVDWYKNEFIGKHNHLWWFTHQEYVNELIALNPENLKFISLGVEFRMLMAGR